MDSAQEQPTIRCIFQASQTGLLAAGHCGPILGCNRRCLWRHCARQKTCTCWLLPGVAEALELLRQAGFLNIVVTNQPDVGAGKVQRATVDSMHARLLETLAIDAVKVCFHSDAEGCACRKPKPGMLLEAAREHGIDLAASAMVGDRWRDVGAAHAAGCKPYFLDCGYSEKRPDKPYVAVKSLAEAAEIILQS